MLEAWQGPASRAAAVAHQVAEACAEEGAVRAAGHHLGHAGRQVRGDPQIPQALRPGRRLHLLHPGVYCPALLCLRQLLQCMAPSSLEGGPAP